MTKKHYQEMAAIFRKTYNRYFEITQANGRTSDGAEAVKEIVADFADLCAKDNNLFNRTKFYEAVFGK